jgi:hypothetical protein
VVGPSLGRETVGPGYEHHLEGRSQRIAADPATTGVYFERLTIKDARPFRGTAQQDTLSDAARAYANTLFALPIGPSLGAAHMQTVHDRRAIRAATTLRLST